MPPITTFLNRLLALTIDLQNILFTAFEQLLTARIDGAIASGTYDLGLETLQADSLIVSDRRTIFTHPGTSARTELLTITQRDRPKPVTLEGALELLSDSRALLLVNDKSGRAAVQIPARSVMTDDGDVEKRVRLMRPMERPTFPAGGMSETHWREADRETFARAWQKEMADLPEFIEATLHVVAGLLLPIWKRLPRESSRVYRIQTDVGERIVARKVSPAWVAAAIDESPATLPVGEAFAALTQGAIVLCLVGDMQLRRVRVMGVNRIELTGFTDAMRERLTAYGLFHEIIQWKLRMFVPTDIPVPRSWKSSSTSIRLSASPTRRHSHEDLGLTSRRQSRAPCRGGLPPLSLQRSPLWGLLDRRRRQEYSRRLDLRASREQGAWQRRRRQVVGICCAESYVAHLRLGAVSRTIDSFYAT